MQHSFDAKRDCRLKLTHRRLFFATLPFLSLGCIRRTRGQIGTLMRHFREEVQRAQRGSDRGTKLVRTLPHKALRFGPNRHERASVNCLKRRHSSQLGPNFEHSLSPIARSCCDIAKGRNFTLCDIAATSSNWTSTWARFFGNFILERPESKDQRREPYGFFSLRRWHQGRGTRSTREGHIASGNRVQIGVQITPHSATTKCLV